MGLTKGQPHDIIKTVKGKEIKKMTKAILSTILTFVVIGVTVFFTFVATMNNLTISVNEESNGAIVECFGQEWYHETTEIE